MKEELFEIYLDLREKEDEARAEIKKLEEVHISPLKAALTDITLKKDSIRDKIIEQMKDINEKTHEHNGYNVKRVERATLKVVDEKETIKHLFSEKILAKVKNLVDKKVFPKLRESLVVETLNKKPALEIIQSLKDVEGIEVKGTEVQVTEYLQVESK